MAPFLFTVDFYCNVLYNTSMKWYSEITDWSDSNSSNHSYLLDDSKTRMFAYKPFGTQPAQRFKNPITINTRGRKFKIINGLDELIEQAEPVSGRVWEVKGSKGDVYKVTELDGVYQCACSGFRFRGQCKHVEVVRTGS